MSTPPGPLPTLHDVRRAAEVVGPLMPPSPLLRSDRLSDTTGYDVWLKREDLQPVRSYKARGASVVIAGLSDEERARGVTCASAGNHAQGVAFACARTGVRARVFLPRTTPRQKRERIAVLGGELVDVVVGGDTYDDAAAASAAYAVSTGATPVPAFDDPRTVAGQGTLALEVLDQLDALGLSADALLVPVGGGGLLAGCLTVLPELAPGVRVVGAEPAGAASMAAAVGAGQPVPLAELDPFVDGAAVREVGAWTHAVVDAHRPPLVTVDEGLLCSEMLALYQSDGIIAEPAGALASSALVGGALASTAPELGPGALVVCVLSGGNNDVSRYAEVVERALVHEGRKHYFLVEFPQEPGALRRFLDEVLGPDDDITLFDYVKRNNRETGPALVGVELGSPDDLPALLARMEAAPPRIELLPPGSPLTRYLT
ncbi:MAG: threonine dehydratase [Nocardioides sp.]|nr:threonine dehydratase [Nocardioides sp.]